MKLASLLLLALLTACAAQLPPNNPREHSSYVQCARSAPIMGWGGGTVFTVVLDETKEGGTFKMTADCGGIEATMNQRAAKAASAP